MSRLGRSGEIAGSDDGSHSASSKALSLNNEAENEIAIPIPADNGESKNSSLWVRNWRRWVRNLVPVDAAACGGNTSFGGGGSPVGAAAPTRTHLDPQLPADDAASSATEAKDEGKRKHDLYRAAFRGDWAEAKSILDRDKSLAACKICQDYTALHVAISLQHEHFAKKLIPLMDSDGLELRDEDDFTACTYAVASGMLKITQLMIKNNKELLKDDSHLTMAMLSDNSTMVSYLLEETERFEGNDELTLDEEFWPHLLKTAIACKMNDTALKILKKHKDPALAKMMNYNQETALHVLARQDMSEAPAGKMEILFKTIFGTTLKGGRGERKMQPDVRSLAEELLKRIRDIKDDEQKLDILRSKPILHHAAKVGNKELIVMLVDEYPDLIFDTADDGESVFHVAIKNREAEVFEFLSNLGAVYYSAMFRKNTEEVKNTEGDNVLHLAAYLGPRKNTIPALQMQNELAWFKKVEKMLPPHAIEAKNSKKMTPRELFTNEHKDLLKESTEWMKSTSDSCMLIATIIFTVVYSAAFTVPGGTSDETGHPILMKGGWLTCFFIFEALALFGAALCIITFWSITTSGFEEDQFLKILPNQLKLGFTALFASLIGAISAFMSAYHLMLVEESAWLIKSILLLIYVILFFAIIGRFRELWLKMEVPKSLPRLLSKDNSGGNS